MLPMAPATARDAPSAEPPAAASAAPSALARRLAEMFGIDPRALAVLRIGLGGVLLADLYMRTGRFEALYTDGGVFPRVFLEGPMGVSAFPLHQLSGAFGWQAFLFGVSLVFALLLLVGRFTRVASVASWVLVVSMHSRQPAILNFGDDVFRMALFWSMFLPLGIRWSLDARRHPIGTAPLAPVYSVATAAYLLQIAFVYLFTALLKTGSDWRQTGLALFYALNIDAWVTPLGVWLRQFVVLTRILSFATFALEFVGPILLFVPIWWVRSFAALSLMALHLGIAASYTLGLFPWIDVVVLLPFLPVQFWDRVERMLPAAARRAQAPSLSSPEARIDRSTLGRVPSVVVAVLLLYVIAINVEGVRPLGLPQWLTNAGHAIRINQRWAMFTPNAARFDGWWVIPGTLADGSQVDLSQQGPVLRWERPVSISENNKPFRWAIFMFQLTDPNTNQVVRRRWAEWMCQSWNATHPAGQRLERIEMFFMYEETPDIGQAAKPVEKRFMHAQPCPRVPLEGLSS
jgi:hypothetical protein